MNLSFLKFVCALSFLVVQTVSAIALGQVTNKNRVNLDDVSIQGEANRSQAQFMSRTKLDLDERIKIRRDFKKEIAEGVPPAFDLLPNEYIKSVFGR